MDTCDEEYAFVAILDPAQIRVVGLRSHGSFGNQRLSCPFFVPSGTLKSSANTVVQELVGDGAGGPDGEPGSNGIVAFALLDEASSMNPAIAARMKNTAPKIPADLIASCDRSRLFEGLREDALIVHSRYQRSDWFPQ